MSTHPADRTYRTGRTELAGDLCTGPPDRRHDYSWAVAPGDEHYGGVETLCVGEAA